MGEEAATSRSRAELAPVDRDDASAADRIGDATGMRVWLDDRHPIFRSGLAACLVGEQFRVVGESAGFLPTPDPSTFEVLVFAAERTDLRQAVRLTEHHAITLVAIVAAASEELVYQAVEAGVAAVLLRPELSPIGLVACLRSVAHGTASLPVDLVPRLLERAARGPRAGPDSLDNREREVLRLLAEGEDTREVAARLCYSERTVKNIVHDLLMKMHCNNRAHAVAVATRQGLI
jgi:DNA-binding NarL/FixJ family response regulator